MYVAQIPNHQPPGIKGLTFYRGVIFLGSPQDETTKQKEMVSRFSTPVQLECIDRLTADCITCYY